MTTFRIPTSTESPSYTQRTTLDGREYILILDYNGRDGHWYMTLQDQDGAAIVSGLRVVVDYPLLRKVRDLRRPPGELYAIDLTGTHVDPGLTDLGDRVALFYYDSTESTFL